MAENYSTKHKPEYGRLSPEREARLYDAARESIHTSDSKQLAADIRDSYDQVAGIEEKGDKNLGWLREANDTLKQEAEERSAVDIRVMRNRHGGERDVERHADQIADYEIHKLERYSELLDAVESNPKLQHEIGKIYDHFEKSTIPDLDRLPSRGINEFIRELTGAPEHTPETGLGEIAAEIARLSETKARHEIEQHHSPNWPDEDPQNRSERILRHIGLAAAMRRIERNEAGIPE